MRVPQVLPTTLMPGFGINAEGKKQHLLLPIKQYCAGEPMKTVNLPDQRSISCPLWVVVSAACVCVEHFGDSVSAAQQYNDTAGGTQLTAAAPAGAIVPVGARASLFGRKFRASASAKEAQQFSITAASMKVELDFSKVHYSWLFLDEALKTLPDELPEDPTAEELKAVDDKIKRWETYNASSC